MRFRLANVQKQEAHYAEEVRARQEKQLQRRAKEMGYELNKPMPPTSTPEAASDRATAI